MSDADQLATVTRAAASGPRRGPLHARLRAVHPPELQFCVALGAAATTIGRVATDAPALRHETVSRSHLEIAFDRARNEHTGRDLGSHNGSRVDGRAIAGTPVVLRDQSVVQLGDVCLVYELVPEGLTDADVPGCPGAAPAMMRLRAELVRAAADPSPVLVIGETGCGKEFVAQELHARSGRKGPLLAINCAALAPQLVESQLFGHAKGAFTGATADSPGLLRAAEGGTLVLDEIGELPLELQPKLLRALQQGEIQPVGATRIVAVDVRVIASTNRALDRLVDDGGFRRDLYARLSMWELRVPPVRERRGDLFDWIDRLHRVWCERRGGLATPAPSFDAEAAELLLLRSWPANLREIDRLVHALAAAGPRAEPVTAAELPAWIGAGEPTAPAPIEPASVEPAAPRPAIPTREEFVAAHAQHGGSVRALAKHFGRDRRQIYRWLESFGLRRPDDDD